MDQLKNRVYKLVEDYDFFFEEDDIENLTVQDFLESCTEEDLGDFVGSSSSLSSEYGKEYEKELITKEDDCEDIIRKLDKNYLKMPLLKYLQLSASYCRDCDSALNPITKYCSLCEIQN